MQKTPLILLLSLTAVLIFIVGIRYGQHVESTNKQNAYNFNQATKVAPTAQIKQVKYITYSHKQCKVEFVIPDSLKKMKESTVSAAFEGLSGENLSFSCDKTASGTAELNPYTGRTIYFSVTKDLQKLLDSTLIFLR